MIKDAINQLSLPDWLAILAFFAIIISFIETFSNKRLKFIKILLSLIIAFGILIITFSKDKKDKEDKSENDKLIKEHFKSDSIHRSADSLAGLIFDERSNKMLIMDSQLVKSLLASEETNSIETPTLEIFPKQKANVSGDYFLDGISLYNHKDRNYIFLINLVSKDAASTSFNIKTSVFVSDSNRKVIYIGKQNLLKDKIRLAKDESTNPYIFISDSIPFEMVCLWLRGTYQNASKTKTFIMNEAYYFNVKANIFGTVIGEWKKVLMKSVSLNEK